MASPLYALVDGNNFYVSCERVFRPSLNGKPVVENGVIPGLDMEALREQAARATAELH